jgi:biopolymer transport protein TolR
MGASLNSGSTGGRRRGSRRAANRPMSEINVTPFVDVMLVLLIIFMVTAPMLTAGVSIDLPQSKAKELPAQNDQPITITVDGKGQIFMGEEKTALKPEELVVKLTAISTAKGKSGFDERIFVRGDKKVDYGSVMGVMGRISLAGFKKVALVTDTEKR